MLDLIAPIRRRRLWVAWLAAMAVLAVCIVVGWIVFRLSGSSSSGRWSEVLLVVVGVTSNVGGVIVAATYLSRAHTTISDYGIRQLTLRGWRTVEWNAIIAVGVERRPGQEIVAVEAPGRVIHSDTQYFDRERLMMCLNARELRYANVA